MAKGLYIDYSDFTNAAASIGVSMERLKDGVDTALNTAAIEMEGTAKELAPNYVGFLAGQISANTEKFLEKEINVNAFYAAYVEFGTGKYAAQQVSKLPPDWQAYAAQFKGKGGGGDYYDFLNNILDWVKRKNLAQITNSYTGRKTTKKEDLLLVAEAVALSIIRNGIHPHPFLYPAYVQHKKQLITDIENTIKDLKINK